MDTTTTSTDAQVPVTTIPTLGPDDLSFEVFGQARGWKRAPKPRPHEDLQAVLEESYGHGVVVLLNARVGLGKTEGVLRELARSQKRAIVLADSHKLTDEWESRAQAVGVDAKKPMSLEEGCAEQERVREVLNAGHQRSLACFRCPSRPNCPYLASHREARKATVLVATKAMARDEGALRRLSDDREATIVEEDALGLLAPAFTIDPLDLPVARAWLTRADAGGFTAAGQRAREAVLRVLTALETTHAVVAPKGMAVDEMYEEHALARDIPISPEDRAAILGSGWLGVLRAARREVQATIDWNRARRPGTPARKLPKNIMPTLRVFAKEAGNSQMLRVAAGWRVTSRPRLPARTPVWILDATADPDVTKHVMRGRGRRLRIVGGGEPLPGRCFQVGGQKVFSRASLRDPGADTFSAERIEEAAKMISTTFRNVGAQAPGIVSFKGLLDEKAGAPLRQAVAEDLKIDDVRALWFGNLRSQDSLKDRDALVVYGTPTPHQDEIRRVALLLGATWRDLYATPRPMHYEQDGEVVPVFAYRPGPMLLAWHLLVRSEVLQAAGRAMRGNQSATIFIFASCIIGSGVKHKSLSELGLTGVAQRVVSRGIELYEEEMRYAGGTQLGAELALDDRHRAIRVGVAALPFWVNERYIVQHGGRTGCPATVTTAGLGVIPPSEVLMSQSLQDIDTGSPEGVQSLITPLKAQDSNAQSLTLQDLGQIEGLTSGLTVDPTEVIIDRIRQFPTDLQALLVPHLTDEEVIRMLRSRSSPSIPRRIEDDIVEELLRMGD